MCKEDDLVVFVVVDCCYDHYNLIEVFGVSFRSKDELISEKSYDIDLKAGNFGDSNGFEDELRKVSKQPGSGVPSHFHNSIPTLLQSAHLDDRQVGHLDGPNADHSCHLTHRSPDHSCGHHRQHTMPMSSPVSVISTSVELAGHSTAGLSGDEPMVSYTCEDIHQEQSTDSVMTLPDMFLKKVKPDDGHMVAGNDHHVQSELRKTTKRPSSGGPSLQHNDAPDSVVTSTSRALNRLDPPVKSGSSHNTFTYSTAGGGKSDQVPHDKPADASYLQSLAKTSVPPHSGSSSKNHNSVSNLVASE